VALVQNESKNGSAETWVFICQRGAMKTLDLISKILSEDSFSEGRDSIMVLAFEKSLLEGRSVLHHVYPAR
jgi:hypothetical protein